MQNLIDILGNLPEIILNIEVILVALIAIFLLIPGDQPEKTLQSIVDFIKKFSKK